MMRILLFLVVLLGALSVSARADVPVIVELYTSQGCNACPPADAYLGELAGRESVIALSMHVDYWDYLGWRDRFARDACVRRQKRYRDALGNRMVYTPQMVVQGRGEAVGSAREDVESLISAARAAPAEAELSIDRTGGRLVGTVRPVSGRGGVLWVARYARTREVEITRGENAGRRVVYHNVVGLLMQLGRWDGTAPREVDLPSPAPGEGIAFWLQRPGGGPILAAAHFAE